MQLIFLDFLVRKRRGILTSYQIFHLALRIAKQELKTKTKLQCLAKSVGL